MTNKSVRGIIVNNKDKVILHLCCDDDIHSDSQPYIDAGYDVRLIGESIGVENYHPLQNTYGIIANPVCTQFSWAKSTGKPRDLREGMRLVKECLRVVWEAQYDLPKAFSKKTTLKFWMLENPCGLLQYFLGKPAFIYHPYEFGDNYKKKTHIFGYFNEPKKIHSNASEVMTQEEIERCKINARVLPKFDRLKTKEIHEEYYGKFDRRRRRSICSPGFAKAFFEANR